MQDSSLPPPDAILMGALRAYEADGEEGFEAFLEQHPEHADEARRGFEQLRELGLLNAPASADFPERLGDFHLLERIGGGGMGVVYRARQESLRRVVALKLIRPDQLYFPGAQERFRREVEIVARLQHPGIVPVYTVGEESGMPFFAMENVRGCTLDEALAELDAQAGTKRSGPALAEVVRKLVGRAHATSDSQTETNASVFAGTWLETALRIVRQVAEALEYAHREGVVHRDIKPSNIMVTGEGRVMLLDFGLSTSQGTSKLTASSSHLGTLEYMPPEGLEQGAAVLDARSDVYSAGVVLYQLLAGTTPYHASTRSETLSLIVEGRPPALRKRAPQITWEAETVCLAALDRDPRRRYASAADFARDLTNALEQRPVHARRAGAGLRTWRWIQRHPAASVGIAFAASLLIGGPLLDASHQRELVQQKTEQLAALEEAQGETEAQRARAVANLERAMEAVDRFLTRVSDDTLVDVPQMESLRLNLLRDALEFHRGFLGENGDTPATRLAVARSLRKMASLLLRLGQAPESEATHREAVQLAGALVDEAPDNDEYREELARARIDLGRALGVTGQFDECAGVLADTSALLTDMTGDDPDNETWRAMLVLNLANESNLFAQTGRTEEAITALTRATELQGRLVTSSRSTESGSPEAVRQRTILAMLTGNLAQISRGSSDPRDTAEALRRAIDLLAYEAENLEAFDRSQLAALRTALAGLLVEAGDPAEAERLAEVARSSLAALVAEFPNTIEYRAKLSGAWNALGRVAVAADDADLARERYREAADLLEPITSGVQPPPEYVDQHASSVEALADLARAAEDAEAEGKELAESVRLRRLLVEIRPDDAASSERLGESQRRLEELGAQPAASGD